MAGAGHERHATQWLRARRRGIAHGVAGTSEASMLENLKDDAAKRGANAVVLQGDVQAVKDSNGNTKKRLAAWAIRTG